MAYNYSTVMRFLSSSELNRCNKNGLRVYEANNWFEVIKYPWLTKKLRRKIGHLWNCDLLIDSPRIETKGFKVGDKVMATFPLNENIIGFTGFITKNDMDSVWINNIRFSRSSGKFELALQ